MPVSTYELDTIENTVHYSYMWIIELIVGVECVDQCLSYYKYFYIFLQYNFVY